MDLIEARRRASHALASIVAPSNHNEPELEAVSFVQTKLSRTDFPVPELVLFALTELRDFKTFGPFEKLRWGISADCDGTPFQVTLEKFGPRFYVPTGTPAERVDKIIGCLRAGAHIAESYLSRVAEAQIRKGHVTIQNEYRKFDGAYRFFRDKARETYDSPPPKPIVQTSSDGRIKSSSSQPWKPLIEGGYLAAAMLDAYFSRLEHLLVLVLPFVEFDPDNGRLLEFVGGTWAEKWRTIFDLSGDTAAREAFETLRRLKEELRNPAAHGGFAKQGASFYFHVDRVGALPARLSSQGRSFEFWISHLPLPTYSEACTDLDKCDAFLERSQARFGIKYAETSLNVSFDPHFLKKCRQATQSEESWDEFIDRMIDITDRHANMDY